MAFSEAVKSAVGAMNLKGNVLGITQKALLTVWEDTASPAAGVPGGGGVLAAAEAALTQEASKAAGAAPVSRTLQFHVQYNPSSISFRANAEDVPFQYLQHNIDMDVPSQNTKPPSISMSVRLIFDQMNIKDCFMLEKFKVSTQDLAQLALNKGLNATTYSVQKTTNAFIGMLMSDKKRTVTFQWAGMSFTGEVTEVRAVYTMFSISGRPVRSEVTLNLSQRVLEASDDKTWDVAFEKCFSATGDDIAGGKTAGEMVGNLLNLSI